jgi:hypothetical protein
MPWLSVEEAAGLRVVCTTLMETVREWPVRLERPVCRTRLTPGNLEAALTCFSAAESLTIWPREPLAPAEESRLVELLRRQGGKLKRVETGWEHAKPLLSSAVRAGALPNLTKFKFNFDQPTDWEILSGGMLPLLEEVHVTIKADDEQQLAALEHLRHLAHLQRLELACYRAPEAAFPFPPFIPPSLKALTLDGLPESLFCDLPPMLQASGAGLEKITIQRPGDDLSAEGGAALAQVLRTCSSSLKTVSLGQLSPACVRELVPGLASCCATLRVLRCPWAVFTALPATCPAFPRLTELRLRGQDGEDVDSVSPAWDIMADGRLPALASLDITAAWELFVEGGGPTERGGPLARALEGVAGTLRRLTLLGVGRWHAPGFEVGAAIGKLRRLGYLQLNICKDGRDYHGVGRRMAASGGCRQLREVYLGKGGVKKNIDWLIYEPSLIMPSVCHLSIEGQYTDEEALLLCCGLVQMGYKHRLKIDLRWLNREKSLPGSLIACMRAVLCFGGISAELS